MSSRRIPWPRLWALVRPELQTLAWATFALLVSSGMMLVYPRAVQWLVDQVVLGGNTSDLDHAALLLVGLFLVQAAFAMVRATLYTLAGERIVVRVRNDLYEALIGQDIAFFDKTRTGELTNRLSADTTVLQNALTVNVSMALRFGLTAIGGVGMLLWMSPRLFVVAMSVVPVVAVGGAAFGRFIRKLSKEAQDALARATDVAEETFGAVRTVRAFAREAQEVDRYKGAIAQSYELARRRAWAMGGFNGLLTFAGYGSVALVVWMGGRMVMAQTLTMGELTAFLMYTLLVAMSFGTLSTLYADFMKSVGATERVFELLDERPRLEGGSGVALEGVEGAVRFVDVHFSYPARADVEVLRGFDLELRPGEVVALVGHSGAGKSTVAQLLSRFYDPNSGHIEVDGRDLRELDPRSLRAHIGVVAQEPVLFATTIAENIRYGRPGASLDEVREAARMANALEFVDAFPEGLETLVGERGVQLSGGQKQRVAIARAILKDPRILVLDEATSALDAESEHLVQDALDRLMRGRTTVVIAHRLSTVRDADRVVVVDGGKAAEQGSHDELFARGGIYKKLVERQFGALAV